MREALLIPVTCDDVIDSPGLRAAVRSVLGLGDKVVTAPCLRSPPAFHAGAIHEADYTVEGQPVPAHAIDGSPALCVSGINNGENVGSGVTGSGTVGAATEAADEGVPALAVSLETDEELHFRHSEDVDFSAAERFTRLFASHLLLHPVPSDVDVLKVEVPCDASGETPWRTTRLSRQRYFRTLSSGDRLLSEKRRRDYKVSVGLSSLEPDSDVYALPVDRVVSVTPKPGPDV